MKKIELEDLVEFSKTIKVLYIENNEILHNSSLGVFKIFFDHIDPAKDIDEAYNYFLNNRYNLIITTLELPNNGGLELIRKIRAISKDITVFVISGESDKDYFIDLIKLGIDGYVLKPVKVSQFVEVLQKVIEKFKNKQELFEYKKNLENMVKIKTQEIQTANDKLKLINESLESKVKNEVEKNIQKEKLLFEQSKLASMGEMIGNIAHQWRQPLSIISTAASGLSIQKEMDILNDETLYQSCKVIDDNAQYLSKTIDDFRNFIKNDKKKVKFNIIKEIDNFISLISPSSNSYDIQVAISKLEEIELDGYPNELMQCLLNIFNNSKDALILNNENNRYFFISVYKEDGSVVIELKDNGGGIPENILPKIFEPYFTTKHQSQGTGLGLHISYNIIVNSMGGTIVAKNIDFEYSDQKYKGALFIIKIPIN